MFSGYIEFNSTLLKIVNELPRSRFSYNHWASKIVDEMDFSKGQRVRVKWNSAWKHYQVTLDEFIHEYEWSKWVWVSRDTMRAAYRNGSITILEMVQLQY